MRVHCRKAVGNTFTLRYSCMMTGAFRSVPTKKSGLFPTKVEALEWAEKNIRNLIDSDNLYYGRQRWRLNIKVLKQFNEYSIWRELEFSRSARYELSVLSNYVLPFFVTEQSLNDPNKWGEYGEEFTSWLQATVKTKEGQLLATATAQRAISVANQFFKWMRRKKYIAYENYRSFEIIQYRKLQRRNFRDLVTDELFIQVHDYLKARNQVYSDMWYVQRKMGYRINELMGLAFHWLSDTCPSFIAEEFEAKGFKVFGSILLESQIADQYVIRDKAGNFPRAALKGRYAIGLEYSRTIPVLDQQLWEILVRNYENQIELWNERKYGDVKENYLLFDGANSNTYRSLIGEAFASFGLVSTGTHILRHTLSTEWTALKISEKVSELVLGHKSAAHDRYVHIVAQVNSERSKAMSMPSLRKNVEK